MNLFSPVAQLVEQVAVNDKVTGPSPVGGAIKTLNYLAFFKGELEKVLFNNNSPPAPIPISANE